MTEYRQAAEQLFAGNSEMARRMRSLEWSHSPLGCPETWPQSLRSALSICLNSRFPIAIYWGADCILLYNDAWRPIVGDKHPWSLGRPGREVWSEIWNDIGPELAGVLATGEGTFHNDELLAMHRFGYTEECFFEYTFNPIQGKGGSIDGVFNIVTETTYRVLNDRRVRLLQAVASQAGTAKTAQEVCALMTQTLRSDPADIPFALLYLMDRDRKAVRLCGSTEVGVDSAIAPDVVDLVADDTKGWSLALVAQTGQLQIVRDLAMRFGVLPGSPWSEPPQEAVVLPIIATGQSKVTGVLVAVASPRRRLDDNYLEFFNQVARQITMTIAIARSYEEERRRAEQLAELDRAKTVFFSNVSHEFRTPLTLMLGPTEDALSDPDEPLSANQQARIETVQRNGLRLLNLVNTLLDFSRIEAGRVEATYEPTDLAAFTTELASVFRSAIERANLRLVVDCPPLPAPVYVDREMWEKIVFNLLSNAFKFTFEGEISVNLQWQSDRVQLAVRDTGIGIPATELPYLFERFHRVEGAQGRSIEGSGIGLSLVQELVKLHQGAIDVTSVEGSGTCFTISIPTGTAHLPQNRIGATRTLASTALGANSYLEEALRWLSEDAGEQGNPGAGETSNYPLPLYPSASSARILLADDNADMRDYVKRLLSQQYEVEAVSDGLAALSAVRQQVPDLILTDVMMPNLDGFGLLQALRFDPQTKEVPIILLSARAGEEARIEGLAAGADDYLIKPFSARELLARVEAILKLAQLRREAIQQEQVLRQEAEAAKRQVEIILSSIRDGFYVLDRNWHYTYVNDRYCEMVGMQRAEILGQNVWELFPPAVDTDAYVQLHRAMREQTPLQFEYLYTPWNCWYAHRIYPSPNGLTVFLADISDRKIAEEALRQSQERYRCLAESIPQLVWTASGLGMLLDVNQRWSDYTGLTLEQAQIYGWKAVVHPDDLPILNQQWTAAVQTNTYYQAEGRIRRADGVYRWHLHQAIPQRNEQGQIIWFGTATDIELQKQLEAERDRLLQQEQEARAEAERVNRIKDEFLAILSHELRSPLNPILGWTKLLQTRKFDEAKTAEALATIERNVKLQAQLIDDLLDVARILRGKLTLNASPVNLVSIVESAIETVRTAAVAKSILIHPVLPNIGQVCGDPMRLQQIVWNLLSNAIKFTPNGGRVSIYLERIDEQAQITVQDTGKGISPDFLPHIFEYFRQEDASITRKHGGLGLGLAIVHHLVEAHGGTISATSRGEGQGATFTIRLPLLKVEPQSDFAYDLQGGEFDLTSIRVLLVDDEPDTRELLAFILKEYGAEVMAVASAGEVLALLESFKPDILVSDIGMPLIDGYTLLRQVRSLPSERGGKVPAIALTAYARVEDRQLALTSGFQRHISKPVDPSQLVAAISDLLTQR